MNCTICGNLMTEEFTTFTVVRNRVVYVTEGVPCYECSVCGHVAFSQDVSKRLERYSSGQVVAHDKYVALVFRWNAPMLDLSVSSTENPAMAKLSVPGTTEVSILSLIP